MNPGSLVRILWVTSHPSGRSVLRDEVVVFRYRDESCVGFDWLDGFGEGFAPHGDVLLVEPEEVDA